MRRTTTIASATLACLAASLGIVRHAHALSACTAAQVHSQDPQCPAGTGPCNISKVFQVGDGCTLDFGSRAVTVLGSGEIDVMSNSVTIRAGSFAVAPGGRIFGRGNQTTPPRDRGGLLTLETTGAFEVQRSGTSRGVIDFGGNARGGSVTVIAGGNVTVNGEILANGLTINGGNGAISLRSGGDVVTASNSAISATGGDLSTGGFIDITAAGRVDLGSLVSVRGGDGGVFDVLAGGEAIVRGLNATGLGDAGSGGCASVFAGTRVQTLAAMTLNGTASATGSGGGCGGFIDIEARFGDATISAPISAESGGPDGGGGGVSVLAQGAIFQAAAAPISVQGIGIASCGGEVSLEAGTDVTANGSVNAAGGFGGNLIDVIAGRHVTVNGTLDSRGREAGSFGGSVTVLAGQGGFGNVTINNEVNANGGVCGPEAGCGLGGFTEISGCNVTVVPTAIVQARAAEAGDNLLSARELLRIDGQVSATTLSGLTNGTNTLQHPSRVPAQIAAGAVTPTPTVQSLGTCTAVGQAGCLVPCPACGNGIVEFPETCDQSGTPASCDGCSVFCRLENCNDANVCTSDTCDATLGCRNQPVNEGGSCSDGNVCNGLETCSIGVCRTTTAPPNCNDNNVCTTDTCSPTLGCQNPPTSSGVPCNDNNACTVNDTCNGMGACAPGAPRTCVDGLPCTVDSCNPATGCVFPPAPNGTVCEDGQYCTVNDTCQAGTCSGPARDCNDQNSCTTDSCDENADQCVNTQAQSCCGDGTQNPGEECDDGNTSNQDGCLNTCVLPTCGDGFVRTGVEQCDAGAQNSDAPDAPCRLDCTPRRCGDGIVDALSGEQCDDGGTTAGDGCSASCVVEPPATAALIPGRGIASSDCALEWAYDRPALDRRGIPWIKQTCRDGDPLCDMGTTPGECTFFVWSCANNTDPRLPTCVAGAPGVGNVSTVEARKPSLREAGLRPVDAANRLELLRAAAASQTSAPGACGPRMTIRVPLKAPGKKGVKVLKLVGTTDKNLRDTDVLKLFCTP